MSTHHLDTCKCVIEFEGDNPISYVGSPCTLHVSKLPSEPVAECRAKNAAINAVAVEHNISHEDVLWSFDQDRTALAFHPDSLNTHAASCKPISHQEFKDRIGDHKQLLARG